MTRPLPKPLHRRARADADVLDAIDHYLAAAPEAAAGFVDALEAAYRHIQRALAQDEASCVVFGIPKEAIALGAVDEVLPLARVAGAISAFDARG